MYFFYGFSNKFIESRIGTETMHFPDTAVSDGKVGMRAARLKCFPGIDHNFDIMFETDFEGVKAINFNDVGIIRVSYIFKIVLYIFLPPTFLTIFIYQRKILRNPMSNIASTFPGYHLLPTCITMTSRPTTTSLLGLTEEF